MTYREIHNKIFILALKRGWIPDDTPVTKTGLYLSYLEGVNGDGKYQIQIDSIMVYMNLNLKPQIAAEYMKEVILHYHPTIFDNKVCKFMYFNEIILELNIKTLS